MNGRIDPPAARQGRRTLDRIVELRPGEGRTALWAFATFFCLLTAYYVLRPLRDQLALTGGARRIPWLFTATFLATLVVVPLWSALAGRVARRRLLPITYQIFVANLVLFYFALRTPGTEQWGARVFFIWTSVFNLLVVSIFWALLADLFTLAQGKRLFGFIAAGGSAGALVGPRLTASLVEPLGPTNLLLVSAVALELAALGAARIARSRPTATEGAEAGPAKTDPEPARDVIGGGALTGLREVFTSRYLLLIAGYQLLLTFTGTFGYLLQAHAVEAALAGAVERTRYFANVDFLANLLTLVVQALVTGRLLTRIGLARALLLLPPITALGFGAFAALPTLGLIGALHVLRRSAVYALANPTREALFTVTSRAETYKAKAFIDTVVYRGGDALSSGVFALVARLGAGAQATSALAAAVALPWLLLAAALGRRHARLLSGGAPAAGPPPKS